MAVAANDQTAVDERELGNPDLEEVLERREKKNASRRAVNKEFKDIDDQARAMLNEFQLNDGEVARCGRFRISKKAVAPRSVAFETDPTSRLTITADD